MACRLFQRLFIIIIGLVNAGSLLVLCRAGEFSFLKGEIPDENPVVRLIGNHLRDDILRALQRVRGALHALFLTHISGGLLFQWTVCLLRQNELRQSFQSLLLRHAGTGSSLGTVRPVEVVHHHQGLSREDFFLQLFRQLSLLFYTG